MLGISTYNNQKEIKRSKDIYQSMLMYFLEIKKLYQNSSFIYNIIHIYCKLILRSCMFFSPKIVFKWTGYNQNKMRSLCYCDLDKYRNWDVRLWFQTWKIKSRKFTECAWPLQAGWVGRERLSRSAARVASVLTPDGSQPLHRLPSSSCWHREGELWHQNHSSVTLLVDNI